MFRMQKGTSDGSLQNRESSLASSTKKAYSQGLSDAQCGKNPRYLLPGINRDLFNSWDDQTLWYFYESTIGTMPEYGHCRYLHLQLPALLSRSSTNSALHLAAQAISYAVVCHFSSAEFIGGLFEQFLTLAILVGEVKTQ